MRASEDLETVREFQQANEFGGFFDFDILDGLDSVDDCRREDPAVGNGSLWRDGDGSVACADDGLHGMSDGRRRSTTTTTTTTTTSDGDMEITDARFDDDHIEQFDGEYLNYVFCCRCNLWEPSVAVASPAQCREEPIWRLRPTWSQGQGQLLGHVLHWGVLGWRVEVRKHQRW